jgi:ABC-type nitrate/sulfonate/bicarbonate transport system substrate-binding protein
VDAFNSYSTNEPYFLKQRNIAYNVIEPLTYRIDFYSDVLFTSEDELKNHPKRVEAMRRATLKGWRYAMDHPSEIIDLLINKYQVKKSRDHLEFEAAEMRRLILPDLVEIGHMNPGRWQHMEDTFVKAGLVKPSTVSIGVTTLASRDENIDVLLNRADKALYEAKNAGRNKVHLYMPHSF